jgi:hypothetical protein
LGRFTLATDWSSLLRSYTTLPGTTVRTARLQLDGIVRWRGNASLSWRRQQWSAGLSGYYVGDYGDSGATTTATVYQNLGHPHYISAVTDGSGTRYFYRVAAAITCNAFVSYKFAPMENKLLANTEVRVGVNNLADKAPPLTSDTAGYNPSVYGDLLSGRTWSLEFTRSF